MEKLERYLQFMRETERLKNVLRSARTSAGRHESTAEHTWRLALLALVVTLVVFTLSQRKKARLQNPHDSYHGRYRA